MHFSPQQDAALRSVSDWLRRRDRQIFYLFGYAGTGKTTLARHFGEGVDDDVLYAAYTGKAAYVMRGKGCHNATTIHSLIYLPRVKSQKRLVELRERLKIEPDNRKLRREIELEEENLRRPAFTLNLDSELRGASLLVVDEVSMVDERMGVDLRSFDVPILVLGDPAQLPPIYGAGYFMTDEPDVMLTEVHRQARDNPIIQMATGIRKGLLPMLGDHGESRVTREIDAESILRADQLLVGKNATRVKANARIRQLKGLDGLYVSPGDRLVCLRNEHDKGLLNGSIWYAHDVRSTDEQVVDMSVYSETGGEPIDVIAHAHYFRGDRPSYWEVNDRSAFDFGYALTVHKSQGSQWDSVAIIDESRIFRADRFKWLYTAVTRAAERLDLVLRG